MKSIVKSLCVLMLGLMATTIQAQSPTPIANLDFEITSSTTTMPANYVYSASNAPNLKTQNGIKCIIISDGGGSTAPTFNGSSAPTNGKRWMAFCPDVDCEVTIGIMSNKKKFFIQSKDGEFFSHTNTANAVEEKTVTGLKAGQWYAMCGGSSQVYITKMAFKVSAPAGPVAVTGVTLDKTSASVEAGQTLQLTATVAPTNADNKNVSWSSNNPTVANVDQNGLVTAYSAGNATITVTTEDGSKTATCTVTVTEPAAPVAVTGVSLNKSTTSIYVGASETLTATIAPADATNKAVSWSSDNPSVASVNNGVVTGIAVGQANITVKTTDGNFTATCAVTVETAPIINVTGVTLNKTSTSISIGASETLIATVAPSNAANKNVTWSSSNPAVATVNNGVVSGVSAGTVTITVTTEDGNKTATCSVTVTAGPPVPSTGLTTHVPEIYDAKEIAGGYNGTLRVVNQREYEVYYPGKTNDSYASVCVKPNTQKQEGITTNTSATSTKAKDGWFEANIAGISNAAISENAEFEAGSTNVMHKMNSNNAYKFHVKGFDQFTILAKDKKLDTSSDQSKPTNNQLFDVYIDNVVQPRQSDINNITVRRFDMSTAEHVIEVRAINSGNSELYGFSLRVAQEPRTRYLKGNDTTQTVLQTAAIKSVTYVTKYNNIPGAETKLEWIGTKAEGITLTKVPGPLTDTLLLIGNANCPTGTYTYAVVAYYNGVETSRETGKFKVTSDIKALSTTDAVVYQNEEMDQISFQYYALDASAVNLTWTNQVPTGISGQGTTAGKYIIGGTPTVIGTYPYSITVVGADTTIKGTITVKELNYGNNPVLYLYKNDNAFEKDGVFKYLTSQDGGKRNLITRKAKNDGLRPADQYERYKWILISEDVDADNPEVLALARGEGGLPVLSMKSFSYTPGRLNWGEPDNGSLTMAEGRFITVQRNDHPIFKAMGKKRGDRIQVLDTVVGKGLMPINVSYTGTLCLATSRTRNIDDYYADGPEQTILHEVPAEMHRGQKYICLPIGTEGSNYLSSDGKRLINEAINYILSSQATISLPSLAITDFKIGSYKGKINEANNIITIDVLSKDSNDMKTAQPQITLASPMTYVTPGSGETVDFSNWHYGVDFIVSDYINKRKYNVIVRLYDPQGIDEVYAPGEWVNIYDMQGRKLTTTNEDIRTMALPTGVYIIATQNGTFKITR